MINMSVDGRSQTVCFDSFVRTITLFFEKDRFRHYVFDESATVYIQDCFNIFVPISVVMWMLVSPRMSKNNAFAVFIKRSGYDFVAIISQITSCFNREPNIIWNPIETISVFYCSVVVDSWVV